MTVSIKQLIEISDDWLYMAIPGNFWFSAETTVGDLIKQLKEYPESTPVILGPASKFVVVNKEAYYGPMEQKQ